jgi:hypothetical protein
MLGCPASGVRARQCQEVQICLSTRLVENMLGQPHEGLSWHQQLELIACWSQIGLAWFTVEVSSLLTWRPFDTPHRAIVLV